MPSSDYGNAVGGGLKLKGAKGAGVKKHKKKEKKAKPSETESIEKQLENETALQKVLAEEEKDDGEDGVVAKQREVEVKEYGKTEAQRRHEERRKKRVCYSF